MKDGIPDAIVILELGAGQTCSYCCCYWESVNANGCGIIDDDGAVG